MKFRRCPNCREYKYITDNGLCPTCDDKYNDDCEDIDELLERAKFDLSDIREKLKESE